MQLRIRVTHNGVKETRDMFKRIHNSFKHIMDTYALSTNVTIVNILAGKTEMLNLRSGRLMAGQRYTVDWAPTKDAVLATFYNVDPVAPILHMGVPRAYYITARGRGNSWRDIRGGLHPGADWLKFYWRERWVFAKRVLRRELRSRPFIVGPMYDNVKFIPGYVSDSLKYVGF